MDCGDRRVEIFDQLADRDVHHRLVEDHDELGAGQGDEREPTFHRRDRSSCLSGRFASVLLGKERRRWKPSQVDPPGEEERERRTESEYGARSDPFDDDAEKQVAAWERSATEGWFQYDNSKV